MEEAQEYFTPETFKIVCTHYPDIFELDKAVCKSYFRQYGKILRIIFKSKQRAIVVEYTNREDFLNCLSGSSEYDGHPFRVETFESKAKPPPPKPQGTVATKKKATREKVVKKHKLAYIDPGKVITKSKSYVDNEEINEELAAMGAYSNIPSSDYMNTTHSIIDLTMDQSVQPKPRVPKLNRVWRRSTAVTPEEPALVKPKKLISVKKKPMQVLAKKKVKEKVEMLTVEQIELLSVMKMKATTVDEKYRVLDARDKLLRLNLKKSHLKSTPTIGTCPDMCPEKERLLREIQHQVSIYEQTDAGKHLINHSKAVKQYSRSSADQEAPLAHELRPVSVLQLTMTYLMYCIMDLSENDSEVNIAEWFHFLWDRTRGIRKDITQQALCCQGSVELVEQCARFHIHCCARLMGEDPSVFDQKINTENLTKCLQTLKYMYHDLELKDEQCPNEPEFRAYIILLNLSDGNFMWEVQKLRRDIQKSVEVKFALQVYSAFEKRNYVKFFKLIKSTTYLNACILMRYFVQVRVQAIETLVKCFTPPKSISFYPVLELKESLFFDDVDSTVDFMKTYGLVVNKDGASIMIERSSFMVPEYPYVLERSRGVEGKRGLSVGAIVNGSELSPELYMQMQSHEVYNSFDQQGCLIQDEMFNEIELSIEECLLDEPDSRESTPERKSIVTNIFASNKPTSNITLNRNVSPNRVANKEGGISAQSKVESSNIFAQAKADVFGQIKGESNSIFGQSKPEGNIFAVAAQNANVSSSKALLKPRDETDTSSKPKDNIFATIKKTEVKEMANIFAFTTTAGSQQNIFAKPNIFAANSSNKDPRLRSKPEATQQQNIFALKPNESPKKGGFAFTLNRPLKTEGPIISAPGFPSVPNIDFEELSRQQREKYERHAAPQHIDFEELSRQQREKNERELESLETEKLRLQEEIKIEIEREEQERSEQEEARRRMEEIRRRNEEAAERRRVEAARARQEEIERKLRKEQEKRDEQLRLEQERIAREKQLEEERKRLEEERRRQEAELKKIHEEMEKRKKGEQERLRLLEIDTTVKSLVGEMIAKVDLQIRKATLKRIRENIQRRSLLAICKKWHNTTVRRMKKRKAQDCNPIFVHTKSVSDCAKDLLSKSQDLALTNMKRYKHGRPIEIPSLPEPSLGKLNLIHLTYPSLRRRLCELKEKWHQHIYWKVVISIPDIDEMVMGLHKLEQTLNSYINWKLDKYGNTVYIEQHKPVTYCVEKQQGVNVKSHDASAFVFVANTFNDVMQRRVFENLKEFGVYVKLPVVLILENTANSEEYLDNLKKTGIVSDYVIYSCNLNSAVLSSIIDNGLIFLAKRVEKYPPLEMDTLYSFITKNLCTEIWKKAGSYAKWNHEYNFCMRDPNIVISIYNEGLNLLTQIVSDKNCKEYATFPEIFKEHLSSKLPDVLPCDYRYFPYFWTSRQYESQLESVLKQLKLPTFLEKWPPENDTDLLISVSKYCTEVFKNPKEPLIAVLNILKEHDEYDKIIWTEAIQVIAQEKLKDQNLKLPKKLTSDELNTLVVVYDVNVLNDYSSSEWFYRNNPIIESFKKIISNKLEEEKEEAVLLIEKSRKRALDLSLDEEDVLDVIGRAERMLSAPKNICLNAKEQIDALNRSLRDLEDSINVVKRMDEMKLLQRFIDK